jgi:hypothetical protein
MLRFWITRTLALASLFGLAGCSAGSPTPPPAPPARSAQIALVRDPLKLADLWVSSVDGQQSRLLASYVSGPVCATAADQLVYTTVDQQGVARLQQLNLTTAVSATLVADQEAAFAQPTCSREQVVYMRRSYALVDDEPSQPTLWSTSLGQPAPRLLQGDSASGALNPRWSPDGSAVAFELASEAQLAIIEADGHIRRLAINGTFDWSPDSRSLLVATLATPAGASQLLTVDRASGASAVVLAAPAADLYDPRWSPDGASIAFVQRAHSSAQGEIMQLAASPNATARPLTSDPAFDNFDPQWSPDSAALLWTRKDIAAASYSVWTLAPPEAAPRLVAENAWWGRWLP